MKVTLHWLKELVDFSLSPAELAEALTMAGLEVEEFYQRHRPFRNVKVARVLSVKDHPDADHLKICQVESGNGLLTVVCGAPNVKEGMLAPLAEDGSVIINDLKVETRKIRGVTSEGMLCSEAELGLSERADGLMVLPDSATVGQDLNELLGEPDYVFDISVTANRPDCLSVIGIAREIAAITKSQLRKPALPADIDRGEGANPVKVDIQAQQFCYRYAGRLIRNIRIQPSPYWLAERLHAVGIRPINNVVDVTNYIMMETGQPLHAFDYRLLEGDQIIVRTAGKDETFVTLDGKNHQLDEQALLICDAKKPVALAGIMGGENSEVQQDTTTVFLESAYFVPTNIRLTSKKLEISTESSRRFERGIDPNGTLYALHRATQLLIELAQGQPAGAPVDAYPVSVSPIEIQLSTENANKLLGTTLKSREIEEILKAIELEPAEFNSGFKVKVPTFRPDITRECDLIEEVARLYGYNKIPTFTTAPVDQLQLPNEKVAFKDQLRGHLVSFGLKETVSLSLYSADLVRLFLPADQGTVELVNPISPDMAVFRPNLLLSLLANVAYNRNRQLQNLRFFELGDVAWKSPESKIIEKTQIAGVLAGKQSDDAWYGKPEAFNFYDIKGVVEALFRKIGIDNFELGQAAESFWDYESSIIMVNGQAAGALGKFSEEVCELFKIKVPDVYGFYLDVAVLYENRKTERKYKQIPRFPVSPFDLAIVVDANVPVREVEKVIRKAGGPYLQSFRLFDFYRGEQIQKGKKSLAFSLTFSSNERTLSEEEVGEAVENILTNLKEEIGAELRSG